jgi:FkbH-like protein
MHGGLLELFCPSTVVMQSLDSQQKLEGMASLSNIFAEAARKPDSSLSAQQQLASLVEGSSRIVSPDVAVVQRLYELASSLTKLCEWKSTAQKLCHHEAAGAKWLAAALFEAGADFVSASAVLDTFSCTTSRAAEALRLLARARTLAQSGPALEAVAALKRAIRLSESYRSLSACGKVLTSLERAEVVHYVRTCRLAMLGNATFDFFLPVMKTVAFASGIELIVYNGAYNQHMQEVLDPSSGLHDFKPEVIVLATDWRSLAMPEEAEDSGRIVAQKLADVTEIWNAVASRFRCHVIQHNFVVPEVSAYGGLSGRLLGGRDSLIRQLNLQLLQAAANRSDVSILDIEQVASLIGKRRWEDARMWIIAKQYPATEAVGLLAVHEVALLRAILGLSSKCLVLDLDNTLWGGVIGEDGLNGICLGGGPEGEAFVAFQRYLKALHDRGVILAVCSKNEETDARLPFQQHPEMVLKLEDISLFLANWAPKAENLRAIAKQLNIGVDSLVLVDDNPAERDQVRKSIPEIEVLELPADPALFVETLHRELLFEALALTLEDKARAESYRANLNREMLREGSKSLEEFLSELRMRVELRPFDQPNLPRVVQLINKTNQFNLTTERMTPDQVSFFAASRNNYTQYMHLRDRYGDNGITGVLMASPEGDALSIRVWLISCRVLGRQVEDTMLAAVWNFARASGYKALLGTYAPTAKNQQVVNLFDRLGFALIEAGVEGKRYYRVELTAERPFPPFMEVYDSICAALSQKS